MASGTLPPFLPSVDGQGQADPYEALIDQRLQKTRRQVKGVEISATLIGMLAVTLAYLLVAAVADQWLIPGGLGPWGRSLLFLLLAAGLGYYFLWQRLLPLLMHRINPIFAAQVIERSRPSLKNSLINFLFLRRDREDAAHDDLRRRVYIGLQRTAAAEVAQVEVEAAVDRIQVIRLGYLLAGVLLVACIYLLFSPKNPLVSFSRVILPWADIRPPTRVTISEVAPGDTVAYQGDQLAVTAEIHGLKTDEPVTLYYTTADHQSVDQAVAMTLPEGGYRHSGKLPPGDLELQQDLSYYLAAGDCKTPLYHVKVETALSIDVRQVDYRFPAYTGMAPKTVRSLANLNAIEGTRVTLHAKANQEIQQASVELGNDHRTWLKMKAQGTSALVDFQLLMKSDDPASRNTTPTRSAAPTPSTTRTAGRSAIPSTLSATRRQRSPWSIRQPISSSCRLIPRSRSTYWPRTPTTGFAAWPSRSAKARIRPTPPRCWTWTGRRKSRFRAPSRKARDQAGVGTPGLQTGR